MKKSRIILLVMITVLLSVLVNYGLIPHQTSTRQNETVFQHVMRTGTIRCGYTSWYPVLVKDPNSGKMSGTFYDYTNALGKSLSLKIEWTEEMGFGEFPAALQSGRIDAYCSGTYITAARARAVDFVMPAYYVPLYAFARAGEHRFGADIGAINNSKYTMAVLEGGATSVIQEQLFPKVKPYSLPQLTSPAELFTILAQGKADAVIYDLFTYGDFNKHNPGKVKRISDQAVKVFPIAIGIKPDEDRLQQMLSNATLEMHLSGQMEQIIKSHEDYPDGTYRIALPYQR